MLASGGRRHCGVGAVTSQGDVRGRTSPWGQTDTLDPGGWGPLGDGGSAALSNVFLPLKQHPNRVWNSFLFLDIGREHFLFLLSRVHQ